MNKRIKQLVKYELELPTDEENIDFIEDKRNEVYKNIGKENVYVYYVTGEKEAIKVITPEIAMRSVIKERIYQYFCTINLDEDKLHNLIYSWLLLGPSEKELNAFKYVTCLFFDVRILDDMLNEIHNKVVA